MKNLFFQNTFFTKLQKKKIHEEEMGLEKISIVMPSYNHANFIERSILSVLNHY